MSSFVNLLHRAWNIVKGLFYKAIPRESVAHVAFPDDKALELLDSFTIITGTIKDELSAVEPTLKIEAVPAGVPESVIEESIFVQFLNALYACPNDVLRMSNDMAGLVETSNNLAIVTSGKGTISIEMLLRSSVDSAKVDLEIMIKSLFDLAGANAVFDGRYPGWKPDHTSPILKIMQEIYQKKFGQIPKVSAVHVGLECGILGSTCPDLKMISFGPTNCFPHSPDEKVSIPSVQKFWDFLLETLRQIPAK